ncbi:4a-hydroxytetrahydrobiopterin dehydratase [Maritimibacter sp. DP1N21-5]|uniref:4a-hydroxytetrahydrobiopterin dehydratase n=1 Tax=Maritimibacter sp. DP1N21-5 TaxID=2836867 RepID=UPI001C4571D8|nr:4a-hydroxytetrahydrobiopterin dehydratase [Maritimibacter sp. DP1N21-5]MBV7409727.1 4a-hydroxytetrahydrobiopterin dehydratase [Maritimibacter sp. DP1N21-5]
MTRLADKHCTDLPKGTPALTEARATEFLDELAKGWRIEDDVLSRRFKTRNFKQALDAANAIGALAEAENHHPDIKLGWGYCEVGFTTHSVGGLSENDFICAARIDALHLSSGD